jgi:hypothetical protein
VQLPVQQSVPEWHASPDWPQNEEGSQVPPLQSPEQQSPFAAHMLPSVLQVALSAAHLPPVHVPLQHSLLLVHAVLSEAQAGKPHAPLMHEPLQHAPFAVHALPSARHPPSLPNGFPASPMFTAPLLLPLLPLDAASPPSPLPVPVFLLLPQATNELPQVRAMHAATHTMSALRRRIMRRIIAAVVPAGPSV